MRLAIISDIHTIDSFDKIYKHLKVMIPKYHIDSILVNGDILGLHRIKKHYGHGYDNFKPNMTKLFKQHAPFTYLPILNVYNKIEKGENLDENGLIDFSERLKDYIDERYMWAVGALRKLSQLTKVYFNIGEHESPLHYKVIDELVFILNMDKKMINQVLSQSPERDHFGQFKEKLKIMEHEENFYFISQRVVNDNGVIISGIPGLHHKLDNSDFAKAQERITKTIMDELRNVQDQADAIIILNQLHPNINKKPFIYKEVSKSLSNFMEMTRKNTIPKVLIGSDHTFATTHFYHSKSWYYLLNNAGVNNGIFNVIDVTDKIVCYDIDPNLDQIIPLKNYDLNLANYNEPIQRLKLNYEDSLKILSQRKLDNHIINL